MDLNEPEILIEQNVGDELLVVDLEANTAYTLDEPAKTQFLGAGGAVSRRNLLRGGALLGAGAVVAVALPDAAAASSSAPGTGNGGPTGTTRTGRFYVVFDNSSPQDQQPPQTSVHGTFSATLDSTTNILTYDVTLTGVAPGDYTLDYRDHVGNISRILVGPTGSGSAHGTVALNGKLQFDAYLGASGSYLDGQPLYISESVTF